MKNEMTSRERVLEALRHKGTDRTPFSWGFGINLPAKKKLMSYLGMDDMQQLNDYLMNFCDIRGIFPAYCGPTDLNRELGDGSAVDIWGVVRKPVTYGTEGGFYDEINYYPMKKAQSIKDLEQHRWPSPEWFNTDELKSAIHSLNRDNTYAIQTGNGNIFETSWYMRGFEQMLMDIVLEPEFAWEIMTRVTDFYISYFKKILEAADGMVDIVLTADDIGQQEGLLMSLDLWEQMIKPHHVRLNKALHEYGVKVLYHTDGAVMKAVPGLIDMGIDILEALQFDARDMDPDMLKDNYGDHLCFHGGISVQKTMPHGTAEDVFNEVKERIRVLGRNGGYILAPSHTIQAGTPPENIIAFLNASR